VAGMGEGRGPLACTMARWLLLIPFRLAAAIATPASSPVSHCSSPKWATASEKVASKTASANRGRV